MKSLKTKNTYNVTWISILLFIVVGACTSTTTDSGDSEEPGLKIDTELLGTWRSISNPSITLEFTQESSTNGKGIEKILDNNDFCKNDSKYFGYMVFSWTQKKKGSGISVFTFDEEFTQDCGAARNQLVGTIDQEYQIKNDTLIYVGNMIKYERID